MTSSTSNPSATKKRSASTEDELPRTKVPRSAFTSFDSANQSSSLPLPPLSASFPEMPPRKSRQRSRLRLPFSLADLAPARVSSKRSHMFPHLGGIEVMASVKKTTRKSFGSNFTPSTIPAAPEEIPAPVQTEFGGPVRLVDARTGKITTTRDPRGGFGYDPEANFTPESSFTSVTSVKTEVERPISHTGLGAINLVDGHSGKIITTRDPRGGFGYDPDANFTPYSSFNSVQMLLPPNRNTLDLNGGPLNAASLFGPPRKIVSWDEDDDDSKTVVDDVQDDGNKNDLPSPTLTSFAVSEVIERDSSFDDVLVCRQNGDSSFTSPSTKPCSAGANMVDIATAEYHAEKLLKERPGSEDICESLVGRLERMVKVRITRAEKEAKAKREKVAVPKPVDAAIQLRGYLVEQKEKRLEMGEVPETVELEIRWADWIVEVTQTGVMHLKVPGCTCRPELMALSEEEGEH